MRVAALPASFDPITCGHVDIITRAAGLFDRLIVGVYATPKKNLLFSLEDRVAMVRESVGHIANVDVRPYTGLTVQFCRQVGAQALVRGLRAVSDFEVEYQLATLNRQMSPEVDTICMFANNEYSFLSSSIIKEIAENGGDVSSMVPAPVQQRLRERVSSQPAVSGG